MLAGPTAVILAESDIPGAILSVPMVSHTLPELNWWLNQLRSPDSLHRSLSFALQNKCQVL